MSSSEGTLWIRELLCLTGTPEKEADKSSSHGLKATLLSWVAKSGRFSATEQRCLGHHFDPELRQYSYTPVIRMHHWLPKYASCLAASFRAPLARMHHVMCA